MSVAVEQITELVLSLPTDARALLADRLVESLDPINDKEIRKSWGREALRRLEEVRSGTVETIDGNAALRSVRDAIR